MKRVLYILTFLIFGALSLKAQNSRFYTVHHSRYGTFHHYENGSILVSGRDYAAEIAKSQQEFYSRKKTIGTLSREQVEKKQREQYESQREMIIRRQEQEAANRERLKKLEAQLAEQKRLKTEADYRELKELLPSATSLNDQIRVLEFMAEIKPADEDLMLLFGCKVQAGRPARELHIIVMKMSADFRKEWGEDINAGYVEGFIRQAEYGNALERCNWKFDDANASAHHLYAALQFTAYARAVAITDSIEAHFPGAVSLMKPLREALQLLRNTEAKRVEKTQSADTLYQYALQRRLDGKIDFMNLVLLTTCIRLDPKPEAYREERLYLNAILNCHKAQAEDEAYFLNQ